MEIKNARSDAGVFAFQRCRDFAGRLTPHFDHGLQIHCRHPGLGPGPRYGYGWQAVAQGSDPEASREYVRVP